mmetsp:Transcript_30102/g.33371  ORF Transcript_30102/g.33371 Transcript_30102/m.33371 type:complete len:244 (-) Transcript_30102:441-1172(-)
MSTGIHAGAEVAASRHRSRSVGAPVRFNTVKDAPCISNDVMNAPTNNLETVQPYSSSITFTAEFANILISKLDVPPKLFTIKHTSSLFTNMGMISLLSDCCLPYFSISYNSVLAISSEVSIGDCFIPASPCIPKPISIRFESSNLSFFVEAPGTVTASNATPIVPMPSHTSRAISDTSLRDLPSAAAAPAILCTKTVPATPRAPVIPLLRSSAQSSATATISHSMPSDCARSQAIPKFRRSPV